VQKFTRPLTREIGFAGDRLGVTLSEAGLSVRPVGARKPPHEISWEALLTLVAKAPPGHHPSAEELSAALAHIKAGGPAAPKSAAAPSPPHEMPGSGPHAPAAASHVAESHSSGTM
jgi:hypothetical protein